MATIISEAIQIHRAWRELKLWHRNTVPCYCNYRMTVTPIQGRNIRLIYTYCRRCDRITVGRAVC